MSRNGGPEENNPFGPGGSGGSHGVLPVREDGVVADLPGKNPRTNAATAATAAGVRAFTAQAIAFYFRAPAKAFFRTRVDYLAYARSIHMERQRLGAVASSSSSSSSPQSSPPPTGLRHIFRWLRGTTPAVLTSAIRSEGWSVVPDHVLPPLIANVAVGAVLYTSYLQILGRLHEESSKASRRVYPPPGPGDTFAAGFMAGCLQSLVAAPLDAIQARYDHRDLVASGGGGGNGGNGKPQSMWSFSAAKLREIGPRGIFAGWGMSLTKDSVGSGIFFSTFEYVKAQGYYRFVRWYYGGLNEDTVDLLSRRRPSSATVPSSSSTAEDRPTIIRPHYALEPLFLLLAGLSASTAQQVAVYPLTHIQLEHFNHLEDLDAKARQLREACPRRTAGAWRPMWSAYYRAYRETWAQCRAAARLEGRGIRSWLYRGFWWNAIRQVPSTSAGLIIFELVRKKYAMGGDEVRITKDGYDILLN